MSIEDRLGNRRVVLAANVVDGYPSEFEYTRDFLLKNGAKDLVTLSSPLERRSRSRTVFTHFRDGAINRRFVIPRPNTPPLSHAIDFFLPLTRLRGDIWIGFNPVMTAVGALSSPRATLVNWAIDFVPSRNGGTLSERAYRSIERYMMGRVDIQIENTLAAAEARTSTTGVNPPLQLLAPIGVWRSDFCDAHADRHHKRTVVYFGSLDQRNGAPFLVEVIEHLLRADPHVRVEIVGDGPESQLIKEIAAARPVQVVFHGYIEKQEAVDEILRRSVVALAPYSEKPGLFTSFADPQKLKYYAANSVPVILTDVAPAARAMESVGAAVVLSTSDGVAAWSTEVMRLLNSTSEWAKAANAAYEYALAFQRENIYRSTFQAIFNYTMTKP